jgi:hypothetical protein
VRSIVGIEQQYEPLIARSRCASADVRGSIAHARRRRVFERDVRHGKQCEPLQPAIGADKARNKVIRRLQQQLGRRCVLSESAALLHDRDAIAHLDRLVDVMRDEQDRCP